MSPGARDRCWTIDEAAAWLGVDHKTVRRLIADGSIPAMRVGRVWRIDPDELRAALAFIDDAAGSAESKATLTSRRRRPVRGEFARKARER